MIFKFGGISDFFAGALENFLFRKRLLDGEAMAAAEHLSKGPAYSPLSVQETAIIWQRISREVECFERPTKVSISGRSISSRYLWIPIFAVASISLVVATLNSRTISQDNYGIKSGDNVRVQLPLPTLQLRRLDVAGTLIPVAIDDEVLLGTQLLFANELSVTETKVRLFGRLEVIDPNGVKTVLANEYELTKGQDIFTLGKGYLAFQPNIVGTYRFQWWIWAKGSDTITESDIRSIRVQGPK
jgi:hypothetical protein